MRQLEERLGVRLLHRTTRSVSLTDAGLRLLDRLRPAVEQVCRAVEDLKSEQGYPFEWPFEQDGNSRQISVNGRIMVNDTDLAVRAAVDGLGIAYTLEVLAEPFLRSGQLVRVLEDWSPSFEGLFLYYPGHRQVPIALRALMDMLRVARGSAPATGWLEIPCAAD
jgi:DNA-binding transcriptional LysR family regulator